MIPERYIWKYLSNVKMVCAWHYPKIEAYQPHSRRAVSSFQSFAKLPQCNVEHLLDCPEIYVRVSRYHLIRPNQHDKAWQDL